MGIFTRTGRATMAAGAGRGPVRPGEAGRSPARHTVAGHQPSAGPPGPAPVARGPQQRQAGVDRRYAVVMLAAAATVGIASYLHLDGQIPLGFTTITGEHFSRVSVPEAIIGAVLAAGAVVVTVAPRRGRAVALGVVGFAVLGVLGGLGFVLASSARVLPVAVAGGRPHIAADLAYHLSVLVVLLAAILALARPGFSAARWVSRRRR
jgi:hypothetical protein